VSERSHAAVDVVDGAGGEPLLQGAVDVVEREEPALCHEGDDAATGYVRAGEEPPFPRRWQLDADEGRKPGVRLGTVHYDHPSMWRSSSRVSRPGGQGLAASPNRSPTDGEAGLRRAAGGD
jgi:hypothetical protein